MEAHPTPHSSYRPNAIYQTPHSGVPASRQRGRYHYPRFIKETEAQRGSKLVQGQSWEVEPRSADAKAWGLCPPPCFSKVVGVGIPAHPGDRLEKQPGQKGRTEGHHLSRLVMAVTDHSSLGKCNRL